MMVRTQISLEPSELEAAKRRAGELGISLAELVRQALRRELEDAEPRKRSGISAIFGMISGPPIPVEDYDDIIGDALLEEQERWRSNEPPPESR